MVMFFGALSVWCIKTLVDGKQTEIDRMAADRDNVQAPFLEHWRSTHKEKGPGKK